MGWTSGPEAILEDESSANHKEKKKTWAFLLLRCYFSSCVNYHAVSSHWLLAHTSLVKQLIGPPDDDLSKALFVFKKEKMGAPKIGWGEEEEEEEPCRLYHRRLLNSSYQWNNRVFSKVFRMQHTHNSPSPNPTYRLHVSCRSETKNRSTRVPIGFASVSVAEESFPLSLRFIWFEIVFFLLWQKL